MPEIMTQSILQALFGILIFVSFCWFISENKKQVNYKRTFVGLLIQTAVAAVILHVPFARLFVGYITDGIVALKNATLEGTSFVFGFLGGGVAPFDVKGSTFVFAFQTLPMVIVISALSMLLFHWKILPWIVKGISWMMKKSMGIGGALGVCSAAKMFLDQTTAPLLIRPYLKNMSRSEIFTIMCMGFATTSALIIGLYAMILETIVPHAMVHLVTASIISVPAAITLSRIVVPSSVSTEGSLVVPYEFSGSMDAVSKGTADGVRLFINIIAMLIVFVALVSLCNRIFGLFPDFMGEPITLQRLLGVVMSPVAWLMGISWKEATVAGSLLGIKTILNEFYAFTQFAKIGTEELSVHTRTVMAYALCGFANISSIGIMIGGLGSIVPEKRQDILSLSFKALIVGTLSSCLSGTIVGILMWPYL
ncbi:MAG: nucleoside:proton symporter [Alphaproteobacteria bacterium RIFCSPLOWO2_01_FULL_45_8]|nr:MAG: nucleoside:proton symporter [Alphaproteobacteria bacterium GWA1_45_9]OFW89886.1 MAG: nucleoside:proton symporter [Alphaproteobacteria bacterium RIFCSPHIGHO2_01_FULL_41_14]OFW96468.1 MAG: nucleoside:proton symporter [Alphaproteobacteria bacterium RIFCSPLOWO2_01_FULL_45_8]